MSQTTTQVGNEVRYDECVQGIRWTKVGTVIEVDDAAGRARVLWDRWEYPSGHVKKDGKTIPNTGGSPHVQRVAAEAASVMRFHAQLPWLCKESGLSANLVAKKWRELYNVFLRGPGTT